MSIKRLERELKTLEDKERKQKREQELKQAIFRKKHRTSYTISKGIIGAIGAGFKGLRSWSAKANANYQKQLSMPKKAQRRQQSMKEFNDLIP